jgi:2-dehydro-3-deoxygluconokinase
MADIVTFGEIMLRLSPPGYQRFLQSPAFEATFGGGEANVAVSLARFGRSAAFVTKLPKNAIGDAALAELRRHGVDVSRIARGGERVGIYYCEKGASQRASKVVYDRKHASISECQAADFDWAAIFAGASWFHFTGITPALSPETAAACMAACVEAKRLGLTVSCDLNYRKNLWTPAQADQGMRPLMKHVDYLIANEEDAEKVFGVKAEGTDVSTGKISRSGYEGVAKKLTEAFGFKGVAITLRESVSASDNGWGGMFYSQGRPSFSKAYQVRIVDRVGGGDSFAAGLIYALMAGRDPQASVELAAAASCLKHSIEGDFNLVSLEEAEALSGGSGSGRVER